MKRDIYKQLVSWKQSSSRKPLVLKGARQVGKCLTAQVEIIFERSMRKW